MAYDFGNSYINRLTLPASVLTAAEPRPLSVGFRIKLVATTATQWIYENVASGGNPNFGVAMQGGANNSLSLYTNGAYNNSSTWVATTAWQSLLLTWNTGSPGATAFYRNGAANGTGTATLAGENSAALASIGALCASGGTPNQATDGNYVTSGFQINGSLGEFCMWNSVLDAAEGIAFTAGASGLLIRPAAIRCYMPFNNGVTQDLYRGAVWVQQGANTKQADHPAVFFPTGPMYQKWTAPAGAPTVSMPPWMAIPPAYAHILVR